MNTDELIISDAAKKLIEVGFKGFNGCGSGFISNMACKILLMPLPSDVIRELKTCWFIHDAEYTVSTSLKSDEHKVFADQSLMNNMTYILTKYKKTDKIPLLITAAIHTALIVGGEEAYWQKKSNSSNWIGTVGVAVVALFFFIKSLF
jgi:hypothetical protein